MTMTKEDILEALSFSACNQRIRSKQNHLR